jgi:excisionase family DNA binding protein
MLVPIVPIFLLETKMKNALIKADDLAKRLGIKTQTVYLWVRQKRIPFYRVGRLVKFDEHEVLAHFRVEIETDNPGKNTEKRSPNVQSLS